MNCDATTAFLPNFVGFPSPRGLHSSTVQPRRTPGARKCLPGAVPRQALHRVPDVAPPRSSAAPCQLPPPHPPPPPHEEPPPQEDPPPHEEPPPHEWLLCPPWWPPDEPLPHEAAEPAPPPAHQLLFEEPPLVRWPRRLDSATGPPAFRLATTRVATRPMTTTARMMPMTMAPPSFRSPEAAPRGLSLRARDPCVRGGCPRVSRVKAELRNFRGFSRRNGP